MKKQPAKKRKAPAKNRVAVRSSALGMPLAKARDHWLESAEGIDCAETTILKRPESTQFLRNRLEAAFIAGANWMERHKQGGKRHRRGQRSAPGVTLCDTERFMTPMTIETERDGADSSAPICSAVRSFRVQKKSENSACNTQRWVYGEGMKTNKTAELKQMIEGAIRFVSPNMRTKCLKACMWRLRGPNGEYVGLGPVAKGLPCRFVPESEALVFDGRDNEDMKLAVFERTLGELTVEIIPQIVCAA